MENRHAEGADREEGLARVRSAYRSAADSGRFLSREDLTLLFPKLAPEIDAFFAGRDQVHPVRQARSNLNLRLRQT